MRPVVLFHVGWAGQSRVVGLVEGLDVVLALNLYHALSRNLLQWSQEASPTARDSASGTVVCWSYGSLAVSRRQAVYRAGPCLAKLDRVMSAKYRPPDRLYSAMAFTLDMMRPTMPGGTTQQRRLLKRTS